MTIQAIIGLRNPGTQYHNTRHNAGAWFVEALANSLGAQFSQERSFYAEIATAHIGKHPCKLVLPNTYMNESGLAVRAVSHFYRIPPESILVAHDDLDVLPGRILLKTDGGAGGHNGLRHIIQNLGSAHFHRLRVGIGHPGDKDKVLSFVLNKPSMAEHTLIERAVQNALDIIPLLFEKGVPAAMNQLNVNR
ncbi:MAG: aminoacyl-tRNA hydrolase [Legionellaceae bacterium]|nr:aminoacyl-tRNA hydrolase [Legionellaceae bacterium]